MQNRLYKKFLSLLTCFAIICGGIGMVNIAAADNLSLSACNGGEATNPHAGEETADPPACFSKGEDGTVSQTEGMESDDCSINEEGKLVSNDFENFCALVADGQPTDKVTSKLSEQCDAISDGDPTNKEACKQGAMALRRVLVQCSRGPDGELLPKDEVNEYGVNPREEAMLGYCKNICNVEKAAKNGDGKSIWEKLGDVVEAVVDLVVDILSFIGNMLSCLFGGDTDISTAETRGNFVKVIWFGPIIKALFGGINVIAYETRDVMVDHATTLLGLGLGLWLAFFIMKKVSSQKALDLEEFLTDIGKALMRGVIVWAMLVCYDKGIFDLLLVPIAESFSAATTMIVDAAGTDEAGEPYCGEDNDGNPNYANSHTRAEINAIIEGAGIEDKINSMLPSPSPATGGDDNIVIKLGKPVVTAIVSVNTRLMMLMADGWALVKYGNLNPVVFCLIPRLDYILYGAVFMAFAGVLSLMIPLKYIDAIIKMGIAICLTPLFLTAWAFPSTRKYTMKGLNLFMHTFILVLVMSTAAVICISSINYGFANFGGCKLASNIKDAIDVENEDRNAFQFLLTSMVLIFACVKIIKATPEIANNISGAGGGGGVGSSLERMIGKVGTKGGQVALAGANFAGHAMKAQASSFKDSFESTKFGHAVSNAVSAPFRAATIPFRAAKNFAHDRWNYRLAKASDAGFLKGVKMETKNGNLISEESRDRLMSISGRKADKSRDKIVLTFGPDALRSEATKPTDVTSKDYADEKKAVAEDKTKDAVEKNKPINREELAERIKSNTLTDQDKNLIYNMASIRGKVESDKDGNQTIDPDFVAAIADGRLGDKAFNDLQHQVHENDTRAGMVGKAAYAAANGGKNGKLTWRDSMKSSWKKATADAGFGKKSKAEESKDTTTVTNSYVADDANANAPKDTSEGDTSSQQAKNETDNKTTTDEG